jgi:hypothetical protein
MQLTDYDSRVYADLMSESRILSLEKKRLHAGDKIVQFGTRYGVISREFIGPPFVIWLDLGSRGVLPDQVRIEDGFIDTIPVFNMARLVKQGVPKVVCAKSCRFDRSAGITR